jgi:hypothetical protein
MACVSLKSQKSDALYSMGGGCSGRFLGHFKALKRLIPPVFGIFPDLGQGSKSQADLKWPLGRQPY